MSKLQYCGRLSIVKQGSVDRPSISDMAWCPLTGLLAFGASAFNQVLACTGSDGTRIYVRMSNSKCIEDGWKLQYHARGVRGSVCTWGRPEKYKGNLRARLAVGTKRDGCVEPKVIVINFEIGETSIDCAHVLDNATGGPTSEISSLSWNHTGRFLFILKNIGLTGPYNLTGAFHPTKDLFVVGGPTTSIRGYTQATAYFNDDSERVYEVGSIIKWEHNRLGGGIDNSCFTFSTSAALASRLLATISTLSNAVNIYTLEEEDWPPRVTRVARINCKEKPTLQSISFTRLNVLAVGSHGDNIHIYVPSKAGKRKPDNTSWRCKAEYMKPANRNEVSEMHSVRWHLKAPMFFQLEPLVVFLSTFGVSKEILVPWIIVHMIRCSGIILLRHCTM